jgi:hypothetical protein
LVGQGGARRRVGAGGWEKDTRTEGAARRVGEGFAGFVRPQATRVLSLAAASAFHAAAIPAKVRRMTEPG